jgi:predicted ATPase
MLLLLDNCEHVIDAAASLAAAVLSGVPGVNILATSREPLGVAGEREHRLGPLGSPPSSPGLTAAAAACQRLLRRISQEWFVHSRMPAGRALRLSPATF